MICGYEVWEMSLKHLGKIQMGSYRISKFPRPEGMKGWIVLSHVFWFMGWVLVGMDVDQGALWEVQPGVLGVNCIRTNT